MINYSTMAPTLVYIIIPGQLLTPSVTTFQTAAASQCLLTWCRKHIKGGFC